MDSRIEKLLTEQRHKLASNLNSQVNISLESKEKPLPENKINETVFVDEQFDLERQSSGKYRFYGNIKSLISNPLFNDNVKIFQKNIGGTTKTKVEKVDSDKIVEQDGWFGYFDDDSDTAQEYIEDAQDFNDNKSSLCQLFPFDPGPDRLKFDDPDGLPNYLLKITYPYDTQDITLIKNDQNVSLKDGISIIAVEEKIIGERSYTVFKTPINHGLEKNDIIRFYKMGDLTFDETIPAKSINEFQVVELGDVGGNNRDRCFILDINYKTKFDNTSNFDKKVSTFKRVVGDSVSEYYVRMFKSLTTDLKNYDVYPASYSTTTYGDEEIGFNFKADIDVNGLTDNLGRPLSELYLTIVKIDTDNDVTDFKDDYWLTQQDNARSGFIPNNLIDRFWTHIQGGFKTENDTDVNYNVRAISSDIDIETGLPIYPQTHFGSINDGIDESDDDFVGDISEYNTEELSERILEPVWHRINTVYREYRAPILNLPNIVDVAESPNEEDIVRPPSKNLTEGYMYRPHYRIKIREFSSFIETGDAAKVIGIPNYATLTYSGDTGETEVYRWRDFLDIGFYDQLGRGVEYPFKSGAHYLYLDLNFFLERQDPPCEVLQTIEEIKLSIPSVTQTQKDEVAKFERLVKDPRFLDFVIYEDDTNTLPDDSDLVDGLISTITKTFNVEVTLIDYEGDYPLGDREIPGDCITLPTIDRIPIDDVC
jgi:hypothetical protein